jgi:hypothetical protein
MTAKFAVALVATTMLVAPALAADAVSTTSPTSPATAAAPTSAVAKPVADSASKGKVEVVHRSHRTMVAHNRKGDVKTVKVTRSVRIAKSAPQTWPFGPFTWPTGNTGTSVKVVHHHAHHTMLAHNGKTTVKTAEKPVKTEVKSVGAAPASTTVPAAKADTSKADVKVIKADKDLKNGAKPGKPVADTTTGQAAQGTAAPTTKTGKDNSKVN